MTPSRRILLVGAIAGSGLLGLGAAGPAAAATRGPAVEFEVDLLNGAGAQVASIAGSVGRNGVGAATSVPMSGAPRVGMVRGENFVLTRRPDGTIVASGGLGSLLRVRAGTGDRVATAEGTLARRTRGRAAFAVTGAGVAADHAYRPAKGDQIIVVGRSQGLLRAGLARRYRLVRYNPSAHSRAALLANPARYDRIAGIVFGPDISTQAIVKGNLARTFHNSGRYVGATGNPRALDRAIGNVHYARLGSQPVVVRRATVVPGQSAHSRTQVRQPIYADVRAGQARKTRAGLSVAVLAAFNRSSATTMNKQLAAAEALTDGRPSTSRRARGARGARENGQSSSSTSSAPSLVPVNNPDFTGTLAWYSIAVNQTIYANVSVPGALSFAQCGPSPAPTSSSQWAVFTGTCPNAIQTQMITISLQPLYTVSLLQQSSQGITAQGVTETNSISVQSSSTSSGDLAAGTYNTTSGTVQQPASIGNIGQGYYAFGWSWAEAYQNVQESGLLLTQAVHQILPSCTGCASTSGQQGSVVQYVPGVTTPTSGVLFSQQSTTSGSSWDSSVSNTAGWDVSANVGFFGSEPTGGVSGGYNNSTTTSTSEGGSLDTSVSQTFANWQTAWSFSGNNPQLLQWQTYSNQIPNAAPSCNSTAGGSAPAACGVAYPSAASGNQSGLIDTPSQYGGLNGPAPSCGSLQSCAFTPAQSGASSWPSPFGFGAQMNVQGYSGGTVAAYQVNGLGGSPSDPSLVVGSVTPNVVDNLYFVDQAVGQGQSGTPVGIASNYTQLQILNQQQVSIAATSGGASNNPSYEGQSYGAGLTTYWTSTGQQTTSNGVYGAPVYTTTGLDLCAPPVLTAETWDGGCADSTSLQSMNPPAVYSAAPPTILANGAAIPSNNGQQVVTPGTVLTCSPGTWSGSPTSYSYGWVSWQPAGYWSTTPFATGSTYTTQASDAGTYITCDVAATNQYGTASAPAVSVLVQRTSG